MGVPDSHRHLLYFSKSVILIAMQTKVTINDRGVITIPAALRNEFGLKANDELIVERCDGGILLRPAFSVAIEFYSETRVDEFASEEESIATPMPPAGARGSQRFFLDANVLFLASNRESNAAGLMAAANEKGVLVSSDLAVEEARKYLQVKRPKWLSAFEELLATLEIASSVLFPLPVSLSEQDAPLLCTAIRSNCQFFVTADKQYFGEMYDQKVQETEIISLLRLVEIIG